MADFLARLKDRVRAAGSALCVGIDPQTEGDPFLERALREGGPERFLPSFTRALIDAAVGRSAIVKFQSAYYEAFGTVGFEALRQGIAEAKSRGLLTLLDAKRGDIASTMAAYGRMAFEAMDADALTVTPYMGADVLSPLAPWLDRDRGAYVVWITSNVSAVALQEQALADGRWFAEAVLEAIGMRTGLVLGATKVDRLPAPLFERIRGRALLMPGVGAQGAAITPRLRELCGSGLSLVPQSRSLSAGRDPSITSWVAYTQACIDRTKSAAHELALG